MKKSILCILFLAFSCMLLAEETTHSPTILTASITKDLYLLTDTAGNGNSALFVYDKGSFLIDAKSAPCSIPLENSISQISQHPVQYAVITHWHFDHVGAIPAFKKNGTTIVSHENVRKRLSQEQNMTFFQSIVPPSPEEALPSLTFDNNLILFLGNEEIRIIHLGPGHTDGDAIVYFTKSNVIHLGDLYFEGLYPYIGVSSGGSINYMIRNNRIILKLINDHTKIIPGHGPISDKTKLEAYVNMLETIKNKISAEIKNGKTLNEIKALTPTKEFDEKWGKGFLPPEKFTELVYADLTQTPEE